MKTGNINSLREPHRSVNGRRPARFPRCWGELFPSTERCGLPVATFSNGSAAGCAGTQRGTSFVGRDQKASHL